MKKKLKKLRELMERWKFHNLSKTSYSELQQKEADLADQIGRNKLKRRKK